VQDVSEIRLSNITIACRGTGIYVVSPPRIALADSTIAGCSRSAISLGLAWPGVEASLRLDRTTVSDSMFGIVAASRKGDALPLGIHDSVFKGNRVAAISNYHGYPLGGSLNLTVESTVFERNGLDCGAVCEGNAGAISGLVIGTVHQSSFVGNRPALDVSRAAIPGPLGGTRYEPAIGSLDASQNWWASPAGPRYAATASDLPVGGIAGDVILGFVNAEPHLLAAP
jgi:hypothetical protein